MVLSYEKGRYVVRPINQLEFTEAVNAGFSRLDGEGECYTEDPRVAGKLRAHADEATARRLDDAFIKLTPWRFRRLPHPPLLTPKPYQEIAARFALERT